MEEELRLLSSILNGGWLEMRNFSKTLIALIILITLLLVNIIYWGTNSSFYTELQKELSISQKTVVSQSQLEYINQEFTKYLLLRRDDLNIIITLEDEAVLIFNEREIAHMKDVKFLFKVAYFLIIIGLFLIFIKIFNYYKSKYIERIYYDIRRSLIVTTIISIIFAFIFTTNFDLFWDYFHQIFFSNDLYLLNPKTDFLIQMMPLDFFISMSTRILLSFYILHIIILFLTRMGVSYYGKKNWR